MFTNLVLSGGAIKGFHFIGVLQYLEHTQIRPHLKSFVGSSAGLSSQQIYEKCLHILNKYINQNIDLDNFININDSLGIDDGKIITDHLKLCLKDKWNVTDTTFLESSKKTGLNLKTNFFCVDETPNLNVIDASRASITLPFIFTPIEIQNEKNIDAGIFNNFPIDYIKNFTLKDTL
ncbi:acyl transferase/acyl hydrolase/lysophospholipase, partial [Dunaliella salina]